MSVNINSNETKRTIKKQNTTTTKNKNTNTNTTRKLKKLIKEPGIDIDSLEIEELRNDKVMLDDKVILNTENLYPSLNDASFNTRIANKLEFSEHSKGNIIPECSSNFDILPHQKFVRNFLSVHTPYNSLLLFHGLGSGKTCTAIGVAEETRDYLINMNLNGKIFVLANPNVLINFELQLFNEEKLKPKDGFWDIQNCTGPKFVKEINPFMQKDMAKSDVVALIKSLIKEHYVFMGYIQFAKEVTKCVTVQDNVPEKNRKALISTRLKNKFSNSLFIIDEVHNIRDNSYDGETDEVWNGKVVVSSLIKVITDVKSIRLLLLSATPLFHSPTEIVWLLNIMNLNDNRKTVLPADIFNSSGDLKTIKKLVDGIETVHEIGKEILTRKATGYISYVRGENAYTFPRRVWPYSFSPDNALPSINGKRTYPKLNYNNEALTPIKHLSVYMNEPLKSYQCDSYEEIIQKSKTPNNGELSLLIHQPVQCLNMIYPSDSDIKYGEHGFKNSMQILSKTNNTGMAGSIDYISKEYGKFFNEGEIEKYSQKINTICNIIAKSSGICLIYSQYVYGGIVPMALALEARGFVMSDNTTLFKNGINTRSRDPKKYIMITGSTDFKNINLKKQLSILNSEENKNGKLIKVVLITKTGAEGIDFKFIRQVHIMDPWFNLSRIEQIIGRGVRHCSHQLLPVESRNVEIYLHVSERSENFKDIEPVDLYLYRSSELNAIQIGNVTRILKSTAVDCIINKEPDETSDRIIPHMITSSGIVFNDIKADDYSFSVICDFMENCQYTCTPDMDAVKSQLDKNNTTYDSDYANVNVNKALASIKILFSDSIDGIFFFKRGDLYKKIQIFNEHTINAALDLLLNDQYEYIIDKYGRKGRLINISDLYLFQPDGITDNRIGIADRSYPVDIKNNNIKIIMPDAINNVNVVLEYEKIISEISTKYETATNGTSKNKVIGGAKNNKPTDIEIANGVNDGQDKWVNECYDSVTFINNNYYTDISIINETILEHIIEQISYTDMITLLNNTPNDIDYEDQSIKREIGKYVGNKKFDINNETGVSGFLWWKHDTSSKKTAIKIKTKNNSDFSNRLCILICRDGVIWNEALPLDIEQAYDKLSNMRDSIQALLPAPGSGGTFGSYIGFMTEWDNKRYIIFKIKNMNYNNQGSKCDNSSSRKSVNNLMQGCSRLDRKKNINVIETELGKKSNINICIIHEIILRILDKKYGESGDGERRYLLSPVDALLAGI